MSTPGSRIVTPLRRVRGLGSARSGTEHFWLQRLTAVANLFLVAFAVVFLVAMHDAPYEAVRAAFQNPFVAVLVALFPVSFAVHMRLGMQTAIEDYFQGGTRMVLLLLNTFFSILIAVASVLAVVRMTLGA